MPEGDTIHRTAGTLGSVLAGRRVERFEAARLVRPPRLAGSTITAVEAKGKNVLIGFDTGHVLRTHRRMVGSWHTYRPGERWRKPPWFARVVIEVEGAVAVCFSAPLVELIDERAEAGHRPLATLGPDLCQDDVDLDEAERRLSERADDEVAVALLDQTVAAGIGNIYKSETLFACGVDPFGRVGDLEPDTRRRLLATASRLLRRNIGAGPRSFGGPAAAYGRARR